MKIVDKFLSSNCARDGENLIKQSELAFPGCGDKSVSENESPVWIDSKSIKGLANFLSYRVEPTRALKKSKDTLFDGRSRRLLALGKELRKNLHRIPLTSEGEFRKYVQCTKHKGIITTLVNQGREKKRPHLSVWTELMEYLVIIYAVCQRTKTTYREISRDIADLLADHPELNSKEVSDQVRRTTMRDWNAGLVQTKPEPFSPLQMGPSKLPTKTKKISTTDEEMLICKNGYKSFSKWLDRNLIVYSKISQNETCK